MCERIGKKIIARQQPNSWISAMVNINSLDRDGLCQAELCPRHTMMKDTNNTLIPDRSQPGITMTAPTVRHWDVGDKGNKTFRPHTISPLVVSPLVVSPLKLSLVVSPLDPGRFAPNI